MAFLRKKNCSRTTINQTGGINASATSLTVSSVISFPSTGNFLATVWNKTCHPNPCDDPNAEIILVTDVVGNTFTIERGQEDTIGVAHANKNAVEMLITVGHFEDIENQISVSSSIPEIGEDLTSQIDGIKTIFTISNSYVSNTTAVYLNGSRLRRGFDYTETTDTTITIVSPLVLVGEKIVIDYYIS